MTAPRSPASRAPRRAAGIAATLAAATLLAGAPAGTARAAPACDEVERALAALDAQPRVTLRVRREAGYAPDGLQRLELHRADGHERRVLDGHALRAAPVDESASAALRLGPEGGCDAGPDPAPGVAALAYDAYAERGQSRVTLWIDRETGLPLAALRDGPELVWGRSLARPTRPPQPVLRATGGRSLERIVFEYGPQAPLAPRGASPHDTGTRRSP